MPVSHNLQVNYPVKTESASKATDRSLDWSIDHMKSIINLFSLPAAELSDSDIASGIHRNTIIQQKYYTVLSFVYL